MQESCADVDLVSFRHISAAAASCSQPPPTAARVGLRPRHRRLETGSPFAKIEQQAERVTHVAAGNVRVFLDDHATSRDQHSLRGLNVLNEEVQDHWQSVTLLDEQLKRAGFESDDISL